jgi:hypothetical protein
MPMVILIIDIARLISCNAILRLPLVSAQRHSSPLHLAAKSGNCEIVSMLIQCGADVMAKDQVEYILTYFPYCTYTRRFEVYGCYHFYFTFMLTVYGLPLMI